MSINLNIVSAFERITHSTKEEISNAYDSTLRMSVSVGPEPMKWSWNVTDTDAHNDIVRRIRPQFPMRNVPFR